MTLIICFVLFRENLAWAGNDCTHKLWSIMDDDILRASSHTMSFMNMIKIYNFLFQCLLWIQIEELIYIKQILALEFFSNY